MDETLQNTNSSIAHFAELALSPREISQRLSISRRDFLRGATGAALGSALTGASPFVYGETARRKRKIIVITFGGGARDQETFAPEGQHNIPHLLNELAPQSSFFTHVTNQGILGHYVATASLATGVYETLNNFAAVPPDHPTIFEYFRKELRRPASDAWVVAPSNGFNRIGESNCRSYGSGATVILPKHLLKAATVGSGLHLNHLLIDNYENPLYTPTLEGGEFELNQLNNILRLSVGDFMAHARTLSSPDELSVYIAKRLMQQEAPSLLWITMHDMDIAHAGAYSLYIEGIRRTDRLCGEIWQAVQTEPEYKDNTTLFVLPDFGRDADYDAGGNGFQHHRTGDAASRTTWMMVLGKGVREGVIYDQPMQSIDLVPSLGAIMGFSADQSQGKPVRELL
ncbi:MAG TPA: twin-arginine translocation signal domain-containing protein [Terracidiphilus sp.]|nr:twin-arginine translocation signal domain-containing protein [Terracidiphilus sp.]